MKIKFTKHNFYEVSLLFISITILFSSVIYVIEYSYGNADGVWMDHDIILITYKVLLVEILSVVFIIGLFYINGTVSYITFCVLFTMFLFALIEKGSVLVLDLGVENKPKSISNISPMTRKDHDLSVQSDSILGVKARQNASINWLPETKDRKFKEVQINIDSISRRVTPGSSLKEKYALFLGCSYTFGDGVSDDETMPYYFQQNVPTYKSYNLGYLAYSPLHALARLQHEHLERSISEKNGFGVFTYINDHIDRVIPATRWIELTKGKFPYLNKKNMQTEGLYIDRKRVYSNIVLSAQTSGIKQLFKLGYPKYHTNKHYKLVIDILQQTKKEYIKRFKNENFYIIIFPGNPMPTELKKMLDNSQIKYFDYSMLTSIEDKMLAFDNAHPAPIVYEMVAKKLYQDIQKINKR